ncbi:polygalacturonase [Dysgonomonas alginatilytica]|uniref:Polygalacturonase n=1 Tax=Dysgonomonas alginatilytica TaxID=1605892 RepID=A0A2V3PY21_9BACT|nr:glycoside hydrolase family 28 protein [Dysgonomonas alginatilytica]PXV66306.1 polygalacturonase [Dysgonomonas alginatilytica]
MKKLSYVLYILVLSVTTAFAKNYNVKDFGAVGDGRYLDSPAIQKAIDACTADGGGMVIIPRGTYLGATIVLKDNTTLHLEEGALLLGTTDLNAYDLIDPFTDGLGVDVGRTFIAAVDAKNITIEGKGIIDGQGSALKAKQIETDNRPEGQRWGARPFLLRIVRCQGVKVQDVTLKYSASWTSHYAQSSDIVISNVKITSIGVAHNDGIDIDGCERVRITNCDVESGDDALCFKTTYSKNPCRDIVVDGMKLKSNQAGIKMGTESMAPFENIKISNCHIYNTNNGGIKLLTVDGAHLRNILIEDITMDNVRTPMLFRLGSRLNVFRKERDQQQPTGTFENVVIRNVKAKSAEKTQLTSASGILITGVPGHLITNLTLENIEIALPGGGTVEEGRHEVPEAVNEYPEIKTFGPTIPAYGVWARHADGLKLNNITFKVENPDLRPVFVFEDVKNVSIKKLNAEAFEGSESAIRIENSENVQIAISGLRGKSQKLLEVEGADNTISLHGKQILKTIEGAK